MIKDNSDFGRIISQSITLELNVSKIYSIFSKLFKDDTKFWYRLVLEEKEHAALIRSGREYFEPAGTFPHDILTNNLLEVEKTNEKLEFLIKEFKKHPPTREKAFNTAYYIENSAGELHFQKFMEKKSNSTIDKIFQQLNRDDKNHAKRISSYMKLNNITIIDL